MKQLLGKVAIVTGAGGVGRGIARALAFQSFHGGVCCMQAAFPHLKASKGPVINRGCWSMGRRRKPRRAAFP